MWKKWDGSIQSLHALIEAALIFQRDVMKYDVDVEQVLHKIFTGYLPPFLMEQARRGYFTFAEKYGMEVDKKIAKATHAELERQAKELAEKKAAEAAESEKKKGSRRKSQRSRKIDKGCYRQGKEGQAKSFCLTSLQGYKDETAISTRRSASKAEGTRTKPKLRNCRRQAYKEGFGT